LRLTGSGGAYELVRLTRPLTRPDMRSVSVSGDRGQVALLLVAEGDLTKDNPSLILTRLPLDAGGDWTTTFSGANPRTGACTCADDTLPAGNYRAYLLAARRTTMSARLPGQPAGTTALTTRVKVGHRLSTIPVDRLPNGAFRPVSETNDTFTFRRPGIVLGFTVLAFSVQHDYSVGGCWYNGRPPAAEPAAQVCAGGSSFGVGGGPLVPRQQESRVVEGGLLEAVQPGEWTFGMYYRTAGTLRDVRRFNIWLEYVA
jgi:hypothetical protein